MKLTVLASPDDHKAITALLEKEPRSSRSGTTVVGTTVKTEEGNYEMDLLGCFGCWELRAAPLGGGADLEFKRTRSGEFIGLEVVGTTLVVTTVSLEQEDQV